jgi:hypothetical protein
VERTKRRRLAARMRLAVVFCAHVMALVIVGRATPALAEGDCQLTFEIWAKRSEREVRVEQPTQVNTPSNEPGSCVSNEAVRKQLLDGLVRIRARCGEPTSWLGKSPEQMKTMLDVNESFIATLPVCGAGRAETGTGWTSESTPVTRKEATTRGPCLQVSHVKQERYALVNRRCTGKTILAVVETRGATGQIKCKAYTIGQSLAVRTSTDAPPYVNHECVLDEGRCSKEHLGLMFPECDW